MDHTQQPKTDMPRTRPNLPTWTMTVIDAFNVTPMMRRLLLSTETIEEFSYRPGQDIVFLLPLENGETGRRHYTIRNLDRETGRIAVDIVMHGDTPGPNFARNAKAGDQVTVRGPRGRVIYNPQAAWHVMTGDETCIPGILHILEEMPDQARAFAFIEVQDESWIQPFASRANAVVEWIDRKGQAAGPSSIMLDRLAAFALPDGVGQALIIGETSNVRAQRHHLVARGLAKEQIASEGYWRPDRTGGHDHVDD
jgi:NADPH-dependent ferric siderophore reductase